MEQQVDVSLPPSSPCSLKKVNHLKINLGWYFFSLSILKICSLLLKAMILMRNLQSFNSFFPLEVMHHSFLAALIILLLSEDFSSLITTSVGIDFFKFNLFEISFAFNLQVCIFHQIWQIFQPLFLRYFFIIALFSSPGTAMTSMLHLLVFSHCSLRLLLLLIFFLCFSN